MRVALINTRPWDSSITKHIICFANALSKSEEVLLILRDETVLRNLDIIDKSVKVVFIKRPRMFHPANLLMVYRLIRAIKDFKPDVIDLYSGHPWVCFGMLFLKKYPLIVDVVTAKPRKGEKEAIHYRIASHLVVKLADQIVTFGQTEKEKIADRFKTDINIINFIPFGNYAEIYKKLTRTVIDKKSNNCILFFGRIVWFKGLEYLIKAEPYITKEFPNAKIIIAGSSDDFTAYEKIIVNKDSFILYIQYVSDEMLAEIFKKADLVVLPYLEYSSSHNIQLAYTFKKPIVATNVGSIYEYIEDSKTGYLVPPKNPEQLAKAIIKILKDKKLAKRMGEEGYNRMQTIFSWEEIVKKTIIVYERAIKCH